MRNVFTLRLITRQGCPSPFSIIVVLDVLTTTATEEKEIQVEKEAVKLFTGDIVDGIEDLSRSAKQGLMNLARLKDTVSIHQHRRHFTC